MISQPSPFEIMIEWGEPFTHQDYPIYNYTVIETDLSTGNSTRITGPTLNHTYSVSGIAQKCRHSVFSAGYQCCG